jgi:hypothetical protein
MIYGFHENYPGYWPVGFFFYNGYYNRAEREFLHLPEETQQCLLKKSAGSEKKLSHELEELKMKE